MASCQGVWAEKVRFLESRKIDSRFQPAEVVDVGDVLRQGAGRHPREVRRDGGAAGEAAVGGVGVELRHAAGVRVDSLPAPPHRANICLWTSSRGHRVTVGWDPPGGIIWRRQGLGATW